MSTSKTEVEMSEEVRVTEQVEQVDMSVEKNLFGSHPVSLAATESRGSPAFASDPPIAIPSLGDMGINAISPLVAQDEINVTAGYSAIAGVGSSIVPDIMEVGGPSTAGNLMESSIQTGGFSTATGIGKFVSMFGVSKPQFSIGGLINVPDHLRKQDEQAFTPLVISIGPIHRSNAKLQTMKKCKERFCECFIQRANINLQNLEDKIREREDEIRSYYAETVVSGIGTDDLVKMILVDGMFILENFLRESNSDLVWMDITTTIPEWMRSILKFDLALLENQLPFFVLEMLFKLATFPDDLNLKHRSLKLLAYEFFQCYNFQKMGHNQILIAEIEHLTDLVRLFYLNKHLPDRKKCAGVKLSYSATQLHEAGVKFKGVQFDEEIRGFLDIKFDVDNGVLKIPCVELSDDKVRLIRNIIALEQSLYLGHAYVTDFFVILDFLINTSKDIDLLCDEGILVNYHGDSNAAASAINKLNASILLDYMNSEYLITCNNLNAFYKKRWHKWKATLWRQYFSTPWRFASTSAAIILLLLTAIQTASSLRSTKW